MEDRWRELTEVGEGRAQRGHHTGNSLLIGSEWDQDLYEKRKA